MGLAGVKNRSKIGNDPNNTKWARNTNNYGQRILRQQGWEAGQYLGQKDAAHSELYTAASASHIKAVLRADNLGIGAAGPGANTANQCTGLDIFKDLLGRLNGKSEESIEEQRQVRETAKMTLYVQQRFGPMRFVRGGLLVGDQIKEEDSSDSETATPPAASSSESVESATSAASAESVSGDAETDDSKAARKKAKKEKKERKEREKAEKKEKKEKKEKSKKRKADSDDDVDDDDEPASDDDKAEKKSKKEKKEKKNKKDKSEKKDKKEKKEKDKDKKEKKEKKDKSDKKDKKRRRLDESGASASDDTEDAAPEQPAAAKPVLVSSRHLARRRYINQKRAAVSDPEAIKQIFMIKA